MMMSHSCSHTVSLRKFKDFSRTKMYFSRTILPCLSDNFNSLQQNELTVLIINCLADPICKDLLLISRTFYPDVLNSRTFPGPGNSCEIQGLQGPCLQLNIPQNLYSPQKVKIRVISINLHHYLWKDFQISTCMSNDNVKIHFNTSFRIIS